MVAGSRKRRNGTPSQRSRTETEIPHLWGGERPAILAFVSSANESAESAFSSRLSSRLSMLLSHEGGAAIHFTAGRQCRTTRRRPARNPGCRRSCAGDVSRKKSRANPALHKQLRSGLVPPGCCRLGLDSRVLMTVMLALDRWCGFVHGCRLGRDRTTRNGSEHERNRAGDDLFHEYSFELREWKHGTSVWSLQRVASVSVHRSKRNIKPHVASLRRIFLHTY